MDGLTQRRVQTSGQTRLVTGQDRRHVVRIQIRPDHHAGFPPERHRVTRSVLDQADDLRLDSLTPLA